MNFKASDSEVTGKADSRLKLVRSILVWGEKLLGGSSMVQRTSTLISSLSYSEKFSPMRSWGHSDFFSLSSSRTGCQSRNISFLLFPGNLPFPSPLALRSIIQIQAVCHHTGKNLLSVLLLLLLLLLTPPLQDSCYGSHETQFTASLDLIPLQNWLYDSYCCSTGGEMRQNILFTLHLCKRVTRD